MGVPMVPNPKNPIFGFILCLAKTADSTSPHRLAAPAWRPALDGIFRSPHFVRHRAREKFRRAARWILRLGLYVHHLLPSVSFVIMPT